MSYINFSVLCKYDLKPSDITLLCAIKQVESDYLVINLSEEDYSRFKQLSLIIHVKPKRKDEDSFTSLRLSKEGKKLLEELGEAEVLEEDKTVFEWLKNQYLKEGKEIGNGARTLRHIRDFRVKSGIQKNNLIRLCLAFLEDEDNMLYNQKLEFALYKPLTAFQTRFQLEDSRLYNYYLKKESYFKAMFEEYE